MSGNEQMRAGDADRQRAAEVLRGALDEGRLNFAEYDERVADAYRAVTYADLNKLLADLPAGTGAVVPHSGTAGGPSAAADAAAGGQPGSGTAGTRSAETRSAGTTSRESGSMAPRQPAATFGPPLPMPQAAARIEPPAKRRRKRRRIPLALQILWVILSTAVVINLVVWIIVSVTAGVQYFWPIWVAGPAGAALLGVTVGIDWMRHLRDRDRPRDEE